MALLNILKLLLSSQLTINIIYGTYVRFRYVLVIKGGVRLLLRQSHRGE